VEGQDTVKASRFGLARLVIFQHSSGLCEGLDELDGQRQADAAEMEELGCRSIARFQKTFFWCSQCQQHPSYNTYRTYGIR